MKWFTIVDKDGALDITDFNFITEVEMISCSTFTPKLRNYGMNKLSNRCIENCLGWQAQGVPLVAGNVPEGPKQVEYSKGLY